VSRFRSLSDLPRTLAEALDGGEDVVGGLGPAEGPGIGVVGVDESADVVLKLLRGCVDAAPDLLVGDQGEEALDLVDPGRTGRREVDVPARPLGQPVPDRLGLVGGIVVHHQMHVEVGWHAGLDLIQELPELAGAVLRIAAADHRAGGDVEGGEQRSGAVALVVMGAPLDLAGAHRQQRLAAIQCLDLRLLVHAQHQRAVGRCHVEPDDVADLVDEQRVGRQLEGLGAMRLQPEGAPDAVDGRGRVTHGLGHRTQRPVRRPGRRRFQCQPDRLGDRVVADPARRAGPRLVEQPVQAVLGEAATPLAHRVRVRAHRAADRLVLHPGRRRQHDPRTPRHRLPGLLCPRQRLQFLPLRRTQRDRHRSLAHHDHPQLPA
jgi:hypothetical protein